MLSVAYAECRLCCVLLMLSVAYAECQYAECHYAECLFAECLGADVDTIQLGKHA
jgi:hypothetical protein